jgi:hypothetical protein
MEMATPRLSIPIYDIKDCQYLYCDGSIGDAHGPGYIDLRSTSEKRESHVNWFKNIEG